VNVIVQPNTENHCIALRFLFKYKAHISLLFCQPNRWKNQITDFFRMFEKVAQRLQITNNYCLSRQRFLHFEKKLIIDTPKAKIVDIHELGTNPMYQS